MIEPRDVTHGESLNLERERLKFERQKLSIEVMLKRRELSAHKADYLKQLLTNPVTLAIVGGFITLMTSILTTAFTASQNQTLEDRKAGYARESARETLQADLIKKFVEGPSRDAVRANLTFLVEAGLIPTYAKDIKEYIKANPESAPQISWVGGGISGVDDAVAVASLPVTDPLVSLGRSIGRIVSQDGKEACTAFLVKANLIATANHCIASNRTQTFLLGNVRTTANVVSSRGPSGDSAASFALLRLDESPSAPPLKIATTSPATGAALSIIMFRIGVPNQLTDRSADCRILAARQETFDHLCDTGAGTSGAPMFSADGEVVGIHGGRLGLQGWATRAHLLLPFIK